MMYALNQIKAIIIQAEIIWTNVVLIISVSI